VYRTRKAELLSTSVDAVILWDAKVHTRALVGSGAHVLRLLTCCMPGKRIAATGKPARCS